MREKIPRKPFRAQLRPMLTAFVPGVEDRGVRYRGLRGSSFRDSQPGPPDLSSGLGDRRKSIFLEFFLVQ